MGALSPRPTRTPRPWRARDILALGAAFALALAAGADEGHEHADVPEGTQVVQVVSTLVGGKNIFIPSTIVVRAGQPTRLSIFNTTEVPHGFRIPALEISEVLPAQQEFAVDLPALEPNQVLDLHCHLHTAHRTATLVALPAADVPAPPPSHDGH